jgi:hypothetical protein
VLGLQGRLIVSITVGLPYAGRKCEWEKADGTLENIEIQHHVARTIGVIM